MNLNYPNEFPALQFPKLLDLRTTDAFRLAKKRPHPLTRAWREKRATSGEKFIFEHLISGMHGRKPYTVNGQWGILARQHYLKGTTGSRFCSISKAQIILCVR